MPGSEGLRGLGQQTLVSQLDLVIELRVRFHCSLAKAMKQGASCS